MSKLERQLLEDRALRNGARKNLLADIELLKTGWSRQGLAQRVANRIGGGAKDVFEKASDSAEDNRGVLTALIGAIVLWFASGAVLELIGEDADDEDELGNADGDTPSPDASLAEPDEPVTGVDND